MAVRGSRREGGRGAGQGGGPTTHKKENADVQETGDRKGGFREGGRGHSGHGAQGGLP